MKKQSRLIYHKIIITFHYHTRESTQLCHLSPFNTVLYRPKVDNLSFSSVVHSTQSIQQYIISNCNYYMLFFAFNIHDFRLLLLLFFSPCFSVYKSLSPSLTTLSLAFLQILSSQVLLYTISLLHNAILFFSEEQFYCSTLENYHCFKLLHNMHLRYCTLSESVQWHRLKESIVLQNRNIIFFYIPLFLRWK